MLNFKNFKSKKFKDSIILKNKNSKSPELQNLEI